MYNDSSVVDCTLFTFMYLELTLLFRVSLIFLVIRRALAKIRNEKARKKPSNRHLGLPTAILTYTCVAMHGR